MCHHVKDKGSPYSITERRVPELIPVLRSQPAGDVSHKPDGRLSLLSTRPAVTPATLKRLPPWAIRKPAPVDLKKLNRTNLYPVSKKRPPFYFVNNSVKN